MVAGGVTFYPRFTKYQIIPRKLAALQVSQILKVRVTRNWKHSTPFHATPFPLPPTLRHQGFLHFSLELSFKGEKSGRFRSSFKYRFLLPTFTGISKNLCFSCTLNGFISGLNIIFGLCSQINILCYPHREKLTEYFRQFCIKNFLFWVGTFIFP